MKLMRLFASLLPLLAFVLLTGCASSGPPPDPLAGWTFRMFDYFAPPDQQHHYHLSKAITEDAQNYIKEHNLKPYGMITGFHENAEGDRAVDFVAFPDSERSSWHYILIYNKNNERIKVIKYDHRSYTS
jgi:hypothetical protein